MADRREPPLPGPDLRYAVAGTDDAGWFVTSGRHGARTILSILEKHGMVLGELGAVLDFGCGCGRVLRHFDDYPPVRLHGCDIDQRAVAWCGENLRFAEFRTNALAPPTSYPDRCFDLVWAFSILTHLTADLQLPWAREFQRILKPRGWLIISVHGDSYLPQIPDALKPEYRSGELVVTGGDRAGTNHCGTYHPQSYVRGVLAPNTGFKVVDFLPEGALGNPVQDAWLLRSLAR